MDVMRYIINENDLDKNQFIKELAARLTERVIAGEHLSDLRVDDWIDILKSMGIEVDINLVRSDGIDKVSNNIPIGVDDVDLIMDLGTEIIKLTAKYRMGDISKEAYREQFIMLCLENAITVVSRYAEEYNIDVFAIIDGVGRLIECADVELISLYVIDKMLDVETAILDKYLYEIAETRKRYYEEYTDFYQNMCRSVEQYMLLMEKAFAEDAVEAFEGSVELAAETHTSEGVLKSKQDIDDFFL